MLPGGPLAKKQLTKLKIYNGENHPHEIQNQKLLILKKKIKEILLNNGKIPAAILKSKKKLSLILKIANMLQEEGRDQLLKFG